VIFHSDGGCQYTGAQFAALVYECVVTLWSGAPVNVGTNALGRELFASFEGECLDLQAWPSRAATRRAVVG